MRVLSIDGGGIRGIIPALVLADLERRTGRRTWELFDLVAGTSTGGILACALTLPGEVRSADELVKLYVEEGPAIFARPLVREVSTLRGLAEERYADGGLVDALRRYLGDARLRDARRDVLVTSYDLEAREPFFFKSWREDSGADARAADAARATAAAPTYFEPLLLTVGGRRRSLVDGGVFATNPAMCAYAEARRLRPDEDVRLVSLGTGRLTRPIRHADAASWGLVQWVRPVLDVVFDGVADTVEYQLRQLLGDERTHRFQIELEGASDDLDDASPGNLDALVSLGRELVREEAPRLDALAALLADGG